MIHIIFERNLHLIVFFLFLPHLDKYVASPSVIFIMIWICFCHYTQIYNTKCQFHFLYTEKSISGMAGSTDMLLTLYISIEHVSLCRIEC